MNVLFLVGNGFDISAGLKTRYEDVLNSYLANTESNSAFGDIKKDISDNIKLWGDFEKRLGEITNNYNMENLETYYGFLIDFRKFLVEYLLSEERKIDLNSFGIAVLEPLKKLILSGYIYFSEKSQQTIKAYFNPRNGFPNYYFISFNYTRVFDECLKIIHTKTGPLKNGLSSTNRPHIPDKILHIHGSLDADLIMGVDNRNQIANPGLRDNNRLIQTLVKPEVNNALENLKNTEAYSLIGKSDLIVLFGMSIGLTDSSYWKKIGEWLRRGASHHLLIFYKLDEGDKIHPENKIANFNYIRDIFIRYAEHSDVINRGQIHVCYETDMFNLNLVKKMFKIDSTKP
jgi:hypothetical protein